MTFLLVPLIVVVTVVLVATLASGRSHRDPHRSVRSFSRALDAIEPSQPRPAQRAASTGRGR